MKFPFNKRYCRIGITAFTVVAASICFYYLIFHGDRFSAQLDAFFKVISPVLSGIIFAYLMTPMVNGIENKLLIPLWSRDKGFVTVKQRKYIRACSITLTVLIVIWLIYGFFSILIPNIFTSIRSIARQFPEYVENLTTWSAKFLEDNPDIEKMVIRVLDEYSEEFTKYLNGSIIPQMEALVKQLSLSMISVLKALWNIIIGVIISIYVLYNKEIHAGQAKKIIFALFNTKTANQLIKDVRFTSDTFIGFISGKIVDSIIIGFICFAGTTLLKMPYALLISVIIGVTNVIPFFGPYLGAVPSTVLILMVNPVQAIYFVIFILILQQIDGNLIGPKILGQSTGLSGFWVIFSITIFGGILGVPGMIIGVPFFAVLYAMIRRITNHMLERRGLPVETDMYLKVDYIDDKVFVPIEEKSAASTFRLNIFRPKKALKAPKSQSIEKNDAHQENENN